MVEKVKYDVLKRFDNIEIRQYPELLLAVVEDLMENNAFRLLFQYISGENKLERKIEMTAPVITSEKIPMTAPVITQNKYMAFVMPSSHNKESLPKPINPNVKIEKEPRKILAVLPFKGSASTEKLEKVTQELITEVENQNLKIKGNPILMRYSGPFTPWFLRRNEIAVEITEFQS